MPTHLSPEYHQFSTFRVGALLLGIEVVRVQEVLRYQEMTVVPLAPEAVEGLINLRGQIVVALDMRRSLGLAPAPPDKQPMNVVIHSGEGPVSLLVDEIGDVLQAPGGAWAPPPDNLPPSQKEWISCIYTLPGDLLLVLDAERLLANACSPDLQLHSPAA